MGTFGDFGPHAEAYRARPGYPVELVEALAADAGAKAGDAVADIGAGTGIFTAQLAALGFVVTAIEPNDEMRAQAPRDPRVRWQTGTFEATGLATASQRWITAAQAFHWARPERALPELARALAPGGALTVVWNDRESARQPVVAWTAAAITRIVPGFDEAYRNRPWADILSGGGFFGDVRAREHRHAVTMSRDRYVDLWRSHNRLAVSAGRDRLARFFDELEAHLDREAITVLDVPYISRAWTARRA